MHYWQLGDSPYWGHNAILRVAPFMAALRAAAALGQAAARRRHPEPRLRRGGAARPRAAGRSGSRSTCEGSYEETPATLLEEMRRDRRWCQGNLQHLRLLFTEGVVRAHRALFLNGDLLLRVGAALARLPGRQHGRGGALGAARARLLPDRAAACSRPGRSGGPSGRSRWSAPSACVLFLPKLLAMLLALGSGARARASAALRRCSRSVLLETLATALIAPIRMVFYCRFVLTNLVGRAVGWRGGADDRTRRRWCDALRRHGIDTLIASVWAWSVYWLHPEAFWWLTPVAGALVLSVPLSVLDQPTRARRARARRAHLPDARGAHRPREIRELEASWRRSRRAPRSRRRLRARGRRPAAERAARALRCAGRASSRRSCARRARRARPSARCGAGPRRAHPPPSSALLLSDARACASCTTRCGGSNDAEAAARWGVRPA